MPTEITNDELARRIEHVHRDIAEDLGKIEAAIQRLVPREVYDVQRAADVQRLAALEKAVAEAEEQRKALIRYVVSAIAIPLIIMLVQIVAAAHGVKP